MIAASLEADVIPEGTERLQRCTLTPMEHVLHPSIAQPSTENHIRDDMQHPRDYEGSRPGSLPSDYATVVFSVANVNYCHLCLACSPFTSTCPLLIDTTSNLVINKRHINLATLLSRNLPRPDSRSPKRSSRSTRSSFRPGNRSPKRNGGNIPSRHRPENRSLWNSRESTRSTQTSVL